MAFFYVKKIPPARQNTSLLNQKQYVKIPKSITRRCSFYPKRVSKGKRITHF